MESSCGFCIFFAWFLHSTEPLVLHWCTNWLLKLDGLGNFYLGCHRCILFLLFFLVCLCLNDFFKPTRLFLHRVGIIYFHRVLGTLHVLDLEHSFLWVANPFCGNFTCGLDLWQIYIAMSWLYLSFVSLDLVLGDKGVVSSGPFSLSGQYIC